MSGNHRHRDGTSVDDGGLVVSGSNSGESNIFGTHAVNQGKWYFEWKVLNSNIVKMGFVGVKFDINFNGGDVGIQPGQDALGIGMYYDSRDFLYAVRKILPKIYRPNYRYSKAGIMLSSFSDIGYVQNSLFNERHAYKMDSKLMQVIDELNLNQKQKF